MAQRLLIALALVLVPIDAHTPDATENQQFHAGVAVRARIQLLGADEPTIAAAEAVLDLFADAGLELPALTIDFNRDPAACRGHDGLIRYIEPVPLVMICSDRPYVLPHELAHAWVQENLTDADRAAYVESWNLRSWDDPNHEWNDRGTEHAAFTIQQNLTARPNRITKTWAERAEAYVQLTGLRSPILDSASSGERAAVMLERT